ncbi:MAG: ABC transporter transmembrane domain-containing protein [Sulfitobacter sp.]|nr:ABC transporter transmembrane domain-containing protein [Sulfitobacter sp.]
MLAVTVTLFPLLYLTLELPKRIINDAIGSASDTVNVIGYEMDQIVFLMMLCGFFLLAVLLHGLMKMRINTMKGILAERLLRRFRYTLIARILRFPAPYFERTSQGELVSMVTAESEPMGGLMGDAVAQPVLQAGQMLTILGFLFLQSWAFGLAACALIPLQAWLIPKLQKQINMLNKKRIIQVRALAAEIGEGAAGASTLRVNGGWRYRMAMVSDRLGRLYALRFEIFQKKFFMKFLNNFITQLTPFFFYAVGGYLVITGRITVGALVAALAAYKDLSSPWKELLAYYNQFQDMALRWDTITERFAPVGMIEPDLFEGEPESLPRLQGDIVLRDVFVQDADGNTVLDSLNVTLPAGKVIAVSSSSDEDRRALAEVLTRELVPTAGSVMIDDHRFGELHQSIIAKRIGHATSRPTMFSGSFGENVILPLRLRPELDGKEHVENIESIKAGNSGDPLEAPWHDLEETALKDSRAQRMWWRQLVQGMGVSDTLFARGIEQKLDAETHPELAQDLIALRGRVATRLKQAALLEEVYFFDPEKYNPALPVAENLIFATPRAPVTAEVLEEQTDFMALLQELDIEKDLLELAAEIVDMLRQIFGVDGTDHPLFRKLGLDTTTFENAVTLLPRVQDGADLSPRDKAQLLAAPFVISAEKLGTPFPDDIIEQVLQIRASHGTALQQSLHGLFSPIEADAPVIGLSVLENALFGKMAENRSSRSDELRNLLEGELRAADLDGQVLELIFDMQLTLGGGNLPAPLVETLAVSRATIKSPDVLVLDTVLSSYPAVLRAELPGRLRKLLPQTTIICLESEFANPDAFDAQYIMQKGRIATVEAGLTEEADSEVSADLAQKLRALQGTDLFSGLARKQLRLLAFGARWYTARAGEYVFYKDDDPSSGAFLVIKGEAELLLPREDQEDLLIATSGPGALVGELGLIRNVPRALDMRAGSDLTCLRIGAEEFLAVVGNDARTAYKLLQVVAGYVTN